MKKKRRIIIIVALLVWTCAACFLFYKQAWESECQDFIDECCNHEWSFRAWGWMMVVEHSNWKTNIDDKCDEACPRDCSRYTEERWYFKDKQRQQEYYDNKVKKCEEEYEECKKNSTGFSEIFKCHECDKYWQPRYHWN